MLLLRVVLFLGLVLHKVVWEVLKRQDGQPSTKETPKPTEKANPALSVVKLAKIGVLAGLVIQVLFLNVFPISEKPARLRIVGLALYFTGLATALAGRFHLGRAWSNLEDYQVLPEQPLVTKGIYKFIRHPIYAGDLLLLTGLQLALNSWLVMGVSALFAVVFRQTSAEEKLLSKTFKEYESYKARTKRFLPYVL